MIESYKLRNALKEMKELVELGKEDPEVAHIKADQLLCDVLKEDGRGYLVQIYKLVNKHYN